MHEHSKSGDSVSFSLLDLLVFKARCFGDLSLWYRSQGLGCLMWNLNLLLLTGCLCTTGSLLLVGHPSAGGVLGHTASLPLLPVSVWSFYPLLWRTVELVFTFFFFPPERIVLYVAVGFGVFQVFLYHHVDLPPLRLFVQRKDYIEFLRHIYKLKRERKCKVFLSQKCRKFISLNKPIYMYF